MNTTTLNTARLLSVAFAAVLTLGTLMGVNGLATSAETAAQFAQAGSVSGAVHKG